MLKPICVPCQRFFRCVKSGFYFTEGMPAPGVRQAMPGTTAPEQWEPYKLWSGDKWRCEGCGAEIVSGTGREPIRVQHEPDFSSTAEKIGANQYQVNDC
jgi:hypothetical protein